MSLFKPYWPFNEIEDIDGITLARFDLEVNLCPEHNFKLSTGDGCDVEPDVNPIIFKGTWEPVTYEKISEVEQDGFGGQINTLKRVDRIYRLKTYANEQMVRYFYEMAYSSQELILSDIGQDPAAPDKTIKDVEIEDTLIGVNLYEIVISYKTDLVQHAAVGLAGCCKPLYEEAPYEDDCAEGGGGGGSEEPECGDLNVVVSKDGNDLSAAVTGAPGSFQVNWMYRENDNQPWQLLIENASVISLGEPGIYRAIVLADGCAQTYDQYLYLGECFSIGVQLEQVLSTLVATPSGGCPNGTFEFYLWNEDTEQWGLQTHDGSGVFMPSEDGLYKVIYICGDCEVENVALFSEDAECPAHSVGIDRDGDTLSATGTSEMSEPTFKWYRDIGNGFVELSGETASSLDLPGNGNYKLVVIDDGCQYEAQKLILDPPVCDPCDNVAVGITYEADQLTAHVIGCEEADINWFKNIGNGYTQVGSGENHTTDGTGLYRARINCGDCTKYAYYLVCEEGEGEIGNYDVLEYSELLASGSEIQLPHTPEDVLLVFKDNLMLKKDGSFLGWSWTEETDIVNLSEAVSTNNPAGGETITVLYKIST